MRMRTDDMAKRITTPREDVRQRKGIAPATKAQVSGHRFLVRRAELGLLLGDVRMIHDPLGRLRRAIAFGLSAVGLVALGAGALALFSPNPDPGDARILSSQRGDLFVRVGEQLHPVTNLTSARLAVEEAATPVKAGDSVLGNKHIAVPIGIADAPSIFNNTSDTEPVWQICTSTPGPTESHSPRTTFLINHTTPFEQTPQLEADEALLATSHMGDVVVTAANRRLLPPAETPEGRSIRRRLGIDFETPRWHPEADVLAIIPEAPPFHLPVGSLELFVADGEYWLKNDSGVVRITSLQKDILTDLGWELKTVAKTEMTALPDIDLHIALPDKPLRWQDPDKAHTCISVSFTQTDTEPSTSVGITNSAATFASAVELSGESVATHFVGGGGAVAVETGAGVHLISEHGLRHQLAHNAVLEHLGIQKVRRASWFLLRLLPAGTTLSKEAALTPLY
ncbi:type VII secretion protein EccB [Corynebacterium pseudotuberculosis]|uniref:type VII secretion protein EccB n=1 Tax=Corynebacterium pseudotuberculosis TaxID=1719 RepID=UPI0020C8954A|nr:type VII secretion protein EccB [Corynebacterium pseudotuberculosis]UTO24865.1 type VII secretion protein EccB [Corynebacterium pseudotuberculosis]